MQRATDDFPTVWQSLSDVQRRFLLAAYDIDRRLPHSDGLDKVLPHIGWQTVGLMCGVRLGDVDEFVRTLAELHLVYIMNPEMREIGLICHHSIRDVIEARRRRWWYWAALAAGVLAAAVTVWRLSRP